MDIDKKYEYISTERISQNKIKVIKIERKFLEDFKRIFDAEPKSMYYGDELQEELDEVYDFAIPYLIRFVDEKPFDTEILTIDEYEEKYRG